MSTESSQEDPIWFQKATREFLNAAREAFGISQDPKQKSESNEPK